MTKLTPYLIFDDNAEEVLNFYRSCFDGEITMLSRYKESPVESAPEMADKIMHGRMEAGGFMLMISDGGGSSDGGRIQLSLYMNSADELDTVFAKLAEDGEITHPVANMFWNARFGMLTDKYGIRWMLNYEFPATAE